MQVNAAPPNLGSFPLYSVSQFKNLPAFMQAKGVFLLPMRRDEAMWISLRCAGLQLLKIYAGEINIASGCKAEEDENVNTDRAQLMASGRSIQDYFRLPKQACIEDIKTVRGRAEHSRTTPIEPALALQTQFSSPGSGINLQFELTPDHLDPNGGYVSTTERPEFDLSLGTLEVKTLTGKTLRLQWSPEMTVHHLKEGIQDSEGIPRCQQRLVLSARSQDHRVGMRETGLLLDERK